MLFHQWVHSISPEQSPAEKQRGLHIKTGRKKKKSLWKRKKCVSSNQGDGMVPMRRKRFAVRIAVGAGVCLYWKGVSSEPRNGAGSGLALDQPSGRQSPRCQQGPEHVQRHCQGSGAGWLSERCSSSGPHAQLRFLGCGGETVTQSICVMSPIYGLAVWISHEPL